jgi:PAS domain S-box-containing protein
MRLGTVSALTNDQPINIRGTEISPGDTRELYRQKIARVTLDAMVQFVGLLDAHGNVLEINSVALDAVGIALSDVEGKPFWTTFWWQVSDEINVTLRESIARAASGEFVRWDTSIYGRAGGKETIIIDASLCPVLDDSGKVVFICAEGRDITEKKAQERLIEQQNKDLQTLLERIRELDEIKSQFFANVSHELRTPLALIIGPADRLANSDSTMSPSQRQESALLIGRNARMLLKHVNDLLDVSKLDAGKLKIELRNIDLSALTRLVVSNFELLAEERNISILVETQDDVVASVDPEKIQRVLMNLLSNAFKFVPNMGKVQVHVQHSKSELTISVEDSGPGVRPEMRKAIFERFRQAESGANRQFGGTGLGLSIAKEFVELHQGTLEISDSPLGGACFKVTLPLLSLRDAAETAAASSSSSNLLDQVIVDGFIEELRNPNTIPAPIEVVDRGKALVLVVEDNADMNRFISEALAEKYQVIQAYDGKQGLEKTFASSPDLILSDIMMPTVSGVEMIAEIRKRPEYNHVPILLLTAKADEDLKIKLLRGGAQDFVAKPFSEEDLLVRVANLITLKKSQEQLALANEKLQRSNEALEKRVQERTKELETARDEALAASQLKSQFVASISHEIRTPMSGILGLSELLVSETSGETRQTAQHVLGSAGKLMRLLNDLLDMSKLETGHIDIHETVIHVDQIVDDVLSSLYITAKNKGLKLSQTIDSTLLRDLRGDGDRIRQVLQNLLQNAIKFTEKGSIDINVARSKEQERMMRFCVTDTGPGISASDQKKVFELFVQLDGSNTRTHGGTGLGLSLSRRLVELMGGTIGVESTVGQGSTFWFTLPLKVSELCEAPSQPSTSA